MHSKKIVGKNAPPKLPNNRPRAVPSIPSNTVAPPEDKTMTMAETSSFGHTHQDMRDTNNRTGSYGKFTIGPRPSDYMTIVEKANNPNVGPGSYDPAKPRMAATKNTDWSLQPSRFKEEQGYKDNTNIQYHPSQAAQ